MKIERVNENQIRCTLSSEDLASRHMKISELAYGSEKARALFRELMEQASYELGFEADDTPLMIEAVPLSHESLLLVVSKVDSPEELDTRFSQFSDDEDDDYEESSYKSKNMTPSFNNASASDILNLFKSLTGEKTSSEIPDTNEKVDINITKMFVFNELDEVINVAKVLGSFYSAENTLYRNPSDAKYYFVVSKGSSSPEEYNKVCNILSEYANQTNYVVGSDAYMNEHYRIIAKHNALKILSEL